MSEIESVALSNWLQDNVPANKISISRRSPLFGVGINDSSYITRPKIDGKQLVCQAYSSWKYMLYRAYNDNYHNRFPTYLDVVVCDEWLTFSKFRVWWVDNYVEGWELDKDLLVPNNKVYSPETCVYVPNWLNSFVLNSSTTRGNNKIGVTWYKKLNKFHAKCSNLKTKKSEHLGYFVLEEDAYNAWLTRKLELANELKLEMDVIDLRIYPNIVGIIKSAV